MTSEATRVVNLSEMDPSWNWLGSSTEWSEPLDWTHSSVRSVAVPEWIPRETTWRRIIAAWRAAMWLRRKMSILVSHGPRMTMYGSLALSSQFKRRRHLAYSFNFTELPQGVTRKLMSATFKSVD